MILSHEAHLALIVLAKRTQKDPNLQFWGWQDSEPGGDKWTCLVCNCVIDVRPFILSGVTNLTHEHGLIHLKEMGLLAFI